jgi:methyl-accepting chemotaxis protein
MGFSKVRLGTKLAGGFGLVLVMMAVIAYLGLNRLALLDEHLKMIVHDANVKVELANAAASHINRITRAGRNIALSTDMALKQKEKDVIDQERSKTNNALSKLESMVKTDKGKQLMDELKKSLAATRPLVNKAVELGMSNKTEEAA